MATIYNSEITKGLTDTAKIQINRDNVPTELARAIVPVIECNPKLLKTINIVRQGNSTANSNVSLYTTPTDRDFYLVGAQLSYTKDAACDSASGRGSSITGVVYGDDTVRDFLSTSYITLTAQTEGASIMFPIPIKIARGTTITGDRGGAFAAGVNVRTYVIYGYTVAD